MFHKKLFICILVMAIVGVVAAQDKKKEKKRFHGTIEKVSPSAITITNHDAEKVELTISESSWLRCEYEIDPEKLKNGMKVCVFGKPDKETLTIKGSKAFVMMNDDRHYGWATKGTLVMDGGKAFMEIDGVAYEIETSDKNLKARYQIEPKHLKSGQSIALRANVSENDKVIDYLTVEGNVMKKKETVEKESSDATAESNASTSSSNDVNISIKAINSGVNQ